MAPKPAWPLWRAVPPKILHAGKFKVAMSGQGAVQIRSFGGPSVHLHVDDVSALLERPRSVDAQFAHAAMTVFSPRERSLVRELLSDLLYYELEEIDQKLAG